MDTDWVVWPIFIFEALVFLLLLFKASKQFLYVNMHGWIHIGLIVVCIAIVVSLFHDATTPLNLHF